MVFPRFHWTRTAHLLDDALDLPQLALHATLPLAVVCQAEVRGEEVLHFVTSSGQHLRVSVRLVRHHAQFL